MNKPKKLHHLIPPSEEVWLTYWFQLLDTHSISDWWFITETDVSLADRPFVVATVYRWVPARERSQRSLCVRI